MSSPAKPRGWLLAMAVAIALAGGLLTVVPVAQAHPGTRPNFKMPFICGQKWLGNNWRGHNPRHSIDWNHYDSSGRPNDFGRRVKASAGGRVLASYYARYTGYGHTVVIGHGNGWRTRYAHLKVRYVERGDRVRRGKVIGRVGKSSALYNLSPHLHYEQIHHREVVVSVIQGVRWYDYLKRYQRSRNC